MSKVDEFASDLNRLYRSYPLFLATFSTCPIEGCENSGRGADVCPHHIEMELAGLIGAEKATQLHDMIRTQQEFAHQIMDELRSGNDKNH